MNSQTDNYFYSMCKKTAGEVPSGAWYAYRAWRDTCDNKTEPFEAAEIPWGRNVEQDMVAFVAALREAGVTEIAVTETSTSLMEGVHTLVNAGAELVGPVMVKRQPEYGRAEERRGLKFKIPSQ